MILGIDASQANRKNRSGTEWYAFYLLEEFKKLLGGRSDLRVRLYTRGPLRSDIANNLPENFEVKILKWPPRHLWGLIRLSWEMLVNAPDILFCPAHTIPLTSILSRKPTPKSSTLLGDPGQGRGRTRVFTTLHDVGFKDYPELYDKLSLWYHRFSAWLAVKYAHHIFTVSEFSKNRIMENYHLNPSNITVTYLGAYQKSSAEHSWYTVIAEFGLKPQNYLLYIGRIEPKKNILNMIKGYEMSGSAMPFVLAGSRINTRDIDAYTEARPDLKAKIRFLNYISEEDKQALYRGAAVFLFATLYEGFGLPILEAQCAKTAVITSNTASNPEVAGEGAVFVNPDSPYEIAQAVRQLLNNPVLGQEKIASGLENVKKFQWDQTAEQTLQKLL